MPMRRLAGREAVVSLMILAAGVLALAGKALHWAALTFPSTPTTVEKVYVGHENIALYLGIILLLRAVIPWFAGTETARRWMAWAVVSGGIIAGFALYDLATEKTRAVDILIANTARGTGQPIDQVAAFIHGQVTQGIVRVSFEAGIYLALAGAALAIVAGILNLTWARPRVEPQAPPSPESAGQAPPVPPPPDSTGSFWGR
jgi:hypothetical protein